MDGWDIIGEVSGVMGLYAIHQAYTGSVISPNGIYDLTTFFMIGGLVLLFLSGIILGANNADPLKEKS